MSEVVLRGARRDRTGKGYAKALRRQGKIPAILYGVDEDPVPLEVDQKEVQMLLHREGKNAIISLLLGRERKRDRKTIICDTQYDSVRNELIHVDFKHVALTDTMVVAVPVILKGDSEGVKNEGGILEHILHSVDMKCLLTEIPEHIEVDVAELGLGDSIHVRDLLEQYPRMVSDPDRTVASVVRSKVAAQVEELEEVVEIPEEEVTEPEVIGEEKAEAEAEEENV